MAMEPFSDPRGSLPQDPAASVDFPVERVDQPFLDPQQQKQHTHTSGDGDAAPTGPLLQGLPGEQAATAEAPLRQRTSWDGSV